MKNFFLELYQLLNQINMNGKDLDSILNSLPWEYLETKPDGTKIYTCEIKYEKK